MIFETLAAIGIVYIVLALALVFLFFRVYTLKRSASLLGLPFGFLFLAVSYIFLEVHHFFPYVGAFLRYRMVESPTTIYGLPVNVLAVNIVGSFILGVFSILSVGLNLDPQYTLLVAVGFCGSFTTMSSFALETTNLLEGKSQR